MTKAVGGKDKNASTTAGSKWEPVHIIEVDDKRHVVSRIPGPSDFWADASPEVRFKSAIIIVILCIFALIMDYFSLHWGGVASEAQLMKGNLATESEMTGPRRNYWYDGWLYTRDEVAKRDTRIKPMDVKMENTSIIVLLLSTYLGSIICRLLHDMDYCGIRQLRQMVVR